MSLALQLAQHNKQAADVIVMQLQVAAADLACDTASWAEAAHRQRTARNGAQAASTAAAAGGSNVCCCQHPMVASYEPHREAQEHHTGQKLYT